MQEAPDLEIHMVKSDSKKAFEGQTGEEGGRKLNEGNWRLDEVKNQGGNEGLR